MSCACTLPSPGVQGSRAPTNSASCVPGADLPSPLSSIFEFLWYLERWDISQAVLGIIAVIAVDRFLLKLFIAVFLSREFKNDHSNNAFWSGR